MADASSDPDLIKITELLLVPSSFLVAALGTADTNLHRAGVSVLGLVVSVMWWLAVRDAYREGVQPSDGEGVNTTPPVPLRTRILYSLPLVFAAGWVVSVVVHVMLWKRPLGVN